MATNTEHRAAKAQEKLADSADTLVGSADTLVDSAQTQEDSADRRTKLAADRTMLAAERTYAAWMRTGLAGLAAGVGARKLLEGLVPGWLGMATAIVLIAFAEFCFAAGIWREIAGKSLRPDPDSAKLPSWLPILFNAFMLLVGAAVLVGIAAS
jgi:putative membrane protein